MTKNNTSISYEIFVGIIFTTLLAVHLLIYSISDTKVYEKMCSQKRSIGCNILPCLQTYRNYIYRTIYKSGEGKHGFSKIVLTNSDNTSNRECEKIYILTFHTS